MRWEPEIVRPIVNALIDEFIDTGETDLIKNFTFEFPTRVIATLLGLPAEDLPTFRQWAVDLISYTVKYKQAFESSAALKDYFLVQMEAQEDQSDRGHHRRPRHRRDRRREADRRGHLLVPAPAPARRPGDHLPVVGQSALPAAHPPRAVRGRAGRPRADRPRHRGGPAVRDAADHRAALRLRGHRTRRRRDPRQLGDRRVHGFGQPRRDTVGARRGVRHLPQAHAAHHLRGRRAHLPGPSSGPPGDPGRGGVPARAG